MSTTPFGMGQFAGFFAMQGFGEPVIMQPDAAYPLLVGTKTSQTLELQVGGGVNLQADTAGPLQIGRYSASNTSAIINTPTGTTDFAFYFNSIPKWRISPTTFTFPDGTTQTTSAHSATGFTGAVVTGGCTMNFTNGVLQSKSGC